MTRPRRWTLPRRVSARRPRMPLIRDQDGDPAGAICINDCGELARLDQEAVLTVKGQKEGQPMTVLICPVCQYCWRRVKRALSASFGTPPSGDGSPALVVPR